MKTFYQKLFLGISLLVTAAVLIVGNQLFLPSISFAGDPCTDLEDQIDNSGFTVAGQLPKYCSTESVYNKFVSNALYAIGILAVIMIIYGGYIYMTSASNDEQRKKGRTILTWAVLGLIVVVVAAVLVNVVVRLIVEK